MAAEGVSEEELTKEVETQSKKDDVYNHQMDQLTDAFNKSTYFLLHQELKQTADAWLKHGVPAST